MRILHIAPRYYPAQGGAEHYWREISTRLAARGHDVTILTSNAGHFEYFWDQRQARLAEPVGHDGAITIHRLPLRHWPGGQWVYRAWRRLLWLSDRAGAPLGWLNWLARQTPRLPALWAYLNQLKQPFDLVAGVNSAYEQFSLAGLQFARRRGLPFAYYPLTHLGAGPKPASDSLSQFYTQRHQLALAQQSDALVTITPTEADFYAALGKARTMIRVAEPGFVRTAGSAGDGAHWRQTHGVNGPIVLFLGTFSADKGIDQLLAAAQQLWAEGQQFTLALAGHPTAPFQAQLTALPAADRDRIQLHIALPEADKQDLLAAADLLVLPSRVESFGIVYLEAWAYRKPVVAARTWGVQEDVVHHERDGLLVDFGDSTGLAAAIKRLLADPGLARQLGAVGHENLARRYHWPDKIDIIEALYQELA